MIHGVIGDDWQALDSGSVMSFLKEHRGKAANVDINSPGGLAFDGVSIYNALVGHDGPVNVDVTGIAASAATIIAMAGDKIRIAANASFMIHRAMGIGVGNMKVMLDLAGFLEKIDGQIADTYAARTGRKRETMLKLMDGAIDGTTFNGQEAVDAGFCDEVIPLKKKSSARDSTSNVVPDVVNQVIEPESKTPVNEMEMPDCLSVGDRIVVVGTPHMAGQSAGLIRQVVMGPAYGIQFDGSEDIHQWYVDAEIAKEDPTEEMTDPESKLTAQFDAEAIQREADAVKARIGLLKLDEVV
jgi:ATP-dependent protease ClpP protease subunit